MFPCHFVFRAKVPQPAVCSWGGSSCFKFLWRRTRWLRRWQRGLPWGEKTGHKRWETSLERYPVPSPKPGQAYPDLATQHLSVLRQAGGLTHYWAFAVSVASSDSWRWGHVSHGDRQHDEALGELKLQEGELDQEWMDRGWTDEWAGKWMDRLILDR